MEPDDQTVSEFVAQHPNGAPLEDLVPHFHCTRQRLDQIAKRAIEKCLRKLAARRIYSASDVMAESYASPTWRDMG